VGEREHHPILPALAGAHLDAADDAVGPGRSRDLDAIGVGVLMFEYAGEVDGGRVAADADSVKRICRRSGDNNHEAQRKLREAPDQTQCQFSAFDRKRPRSLSDHCHEYEGNQRVSHYPLLASVKATTQFCQYVRRSPCVGALRRPFPAERCCPSAVLCAPDAETASPSPRSRRPWRPYPHYYGGAA